MKKVLVLTYEEDPHATQVCSYLEERKIDFFRVDTDRLIQRYKIIFNSASGLFHIGDVNRDIVLDKRWTIWNRRVLDPLTDGEVPKELEEIVRTETRKAWQSLLYIHKGKVVNRPQAQIVAGNKIHQLLYVRDNFRNIIVPNTLLTNNPEELARFFRENLQICHKLQQQSLVGKSDKVLTMYTNLVTEENLKNAHLIRRNPSLFQTYIDKEYELRVTALEDMAIGIAIHSQESKVSKLDWRRYDFDDVKYEKVDLPDDVEDFCIRLINHYGLSFGQIDIIVTPEGDYVFLELNPNGQWLWLEKQSGYNLTKHIAENLLR